MTLWNADGYRLDVVDLMLRNLEVYWTYLKYKTHVGRDNFTERQIRDTERLTWSDVASLLRDTTRKIVLKALSMLVPDGNWRHIKVLSDLLCPITLESCNGQ